MVPGLPAPVGREAAVPVAAAQPYAQEPDPEPGDRRRDGHARDPEHHVAPERGPRAQGRQIDPVRDRPEPVPDPLRARGVEGDLAGAGRDVEDRVGIVAEPHEMKGPLRVVAGRDRPLIPLDRAVEPRLHGARIVGRDGERFGVGDPLHPSPIRRRHGVARAVPGDDAIDRLGIEHREPQIPGEAALARRRQGLRRRDRDTIPRQDRKPGAPLGVGQRREADVDHHHARHEPRRKQQAGQDAEPAVAEIQPPLQALEQRARHVTTPRCRPLRPSAGGQAASRSCRR